MGGASPGSKGIAIGSGNRELLGGDGPGPATGPGAEADREETTELDEAGQVIAHDLSEGLATIALFADALETRLGSDLDGETTRSLEGIRAGIERMQSLISGALRFGGGYTSAEHHRPVDANAALCEALANIHARIEQTGAEVVAEPLPWISGDPRELTRLFQNLLANSIKFRDPMRPVRITVNARRIRAGAWREGLRWRFEIADNGIGLDPELAERVFNPSSRSEIGGHPVDGLGLTICQKIVGAHGGRIRAEPRPEGGTMVSFDLPADEVRGTGLRGQSVLGSQPPEARPARPASNHQT